MKLHGCTALGHFGPWDTLETPKSPNKTHNGDNVTTYQRTTCQSPCPSKQPLPDPSISVQHPVQVGGGSAPFEPRPFAPRPPSGPPLTLSCPQRAARAHKDGARRPWKHGLLAAPRLRRPSPAICTRRGEKTAPPAWSLSRIDLRGSRGARRSEHVRGALCGAARASAVRSLHDPWETANCAARLNAWHARCARVAMLWQYVRAAQAAERSHKQGPRGGGAGGRRTRRAGGGGAKTRAKMLIPAGATG